MMIDGQKKKGGGCLLDFPLCYSFAWAQQLLISLQRILGLNQYLPHENISNVVMVTDNNS